MTDLVARLRKDYHLGAHHEASWGDCACCYMNWPCEWSEAFADIHAAADEIERLRKALETIAGQYELATHTHARSLAWTAIEALK